MTADALTRIAGHEGKLHLVTVRRVDGADGSTGTAGWHLGVEAVGGSSVFEGRVDMLMTTGDEIVGNVFVDRFASGKDTAAAVESLVESGGTPMFTIAYRPSLAVKIGRWTAFAYRPFSRRFQSDREHPRPTVFEPDTVRAPTSEAMERFARKDRQQPMLMLNLNKYYDRARYPDGDRGRTGEEAYRRYGARSGPVLASMGGHPAMGGRVIAELDTGISQLSGGWNEVIFAFYPTRQKFMNMVTNPRTQSGIPDRDAAVERAALVSTLERK